MTLPERMLWSRLRNKRLLGLRFRRQHALGPYIADFYCHRLRQVIEVDGSSHTGDRLRTDRVRDAWMIDRGIRILRLPAHDVLTELDAVVQRIADACDQNPHRHPPDATSPAGAGEELDSRPLEDD